MADREILESIDAHIKHGNELMGRNTAAFEANREAFEANREAFEANREALREHSAESNDLREFIREMTLRLHKGTEAMVAELEAGRKEFQRSMAEMRGKFDEVRAESKELREWHRKDHRDMHEESLAHRKAIYALIDELRNQGLGGGSPA